MNRDRAGKFRGREAVFKICCALAVCLLVGGPPRFAGARAPQQPRPPLLADDSSELTFAYSPSADSPLAAVLQNAAGAGVRTDRRVYPEPPLPALPPAGGKYRDAVFGAEVMRVTDSSDYPS